MDKFVFTFIPGGGYFLQGHKGSIFYNMPHYLETLLYGPSRKVDHVRCLTFGDTPHVFFMNYKDIHGMTQFVYHGLPQKLVDWIETPQNQIFQRDHSLRVELGLNGSFFAWDRTTYRWAGLPEMLEDTIQDWIRVGGWIEGPPELVSLGYGDSFYIRTDRKSAYRANMSQEQEPALFFKWQDYHRTGADPKIFHFVCFNKYAPNEFVAMDARGVIDSIVPDALRDHINRNEYGWNSQQEEFGAHPQFGKEGWSKEGWGDQSWNNGGNAGGDSGRDTGGNTGGDYGPRKPQGRGGRRRGSRGETAQERRQREAEEQRQAQQKENYIKAQYVLWKAECDRHFAKGQRMRTFPAPPLEISICELVACKNRKIDSTLMSCVHDMETLLRASGEYSYQWLKNQAINWHPDRIGQRTEPEFRAEANKKSTEMFSIFQELMIKEQAAMRH